MSAVVYLMTLKTDCFKAVWKAYKEYGKLRQTPDINDIKAYLSLHGQDAGVSGIYGKWIILASMLKGGKVFDSIKEKDFYNI